MIVAAPPDGIVNETTGADHLHGGEAAVLDGLVARLAASNITARELLPIRGALRMHPRYAALPMLISPPGAAHTAVTNLPIAALRLPADIGESLHVLGFERIELATQPRPPLTLRFGPELAAGWIKQWVRSQR